MKTIVVLASLLLGAGCSLTQPAPLKLAYLLDPPPARTQLVATRPPAAVLRVNRFAVAQPFDGRALVYRLGDTRYEADYYHEFLAFPATMLTESTLRHLAATGLFKAVVPMTSSLDSRLVLEASVVSLYGDFRAATPNAVIGIRFLMARDGGGEILYDKLIERRIALNGRNAAALVTGYDTALGEVLRELSADLEPAAGN